jgi:hypothetical protein
MTDETKMFHGKSGDRPSPEPETYDGELDFSRSIEECYREIRNRKAAGGLGWIPWYQRPMNQNNAPAFTAAEKHRAAQREVELRKAIYPNRVMHGAMSQREADRQIAIMQAIADDYAKLAERERLL